MTQQRTDPDVRSQVVDLRGAVIVHKVLPGAFGELQPGVDRSGFWVACGVEALGADGHHVVRVYALGVRRHLLHPGLHVGSRRFRAAGVRSAGVATAPHLVHQICSRSPASMPGWHSLSF